MSLYCADLQGMGHLLHSMNALVRREGFDEPTPPVTLKTPIEVVRHDVFNETLGFIDFNEQEAEYRFVPKEQWEEENKTYETRYRIEQRWKNGDNEVWMPRPGPSFKNYNRAIKRRNELKDEKKGWEFRVHAWEVQR